MYFFFFFCDSSGMTGSGKSTTHRHLIKELLYLSTHTRKEERIQKQIIGVNTIFESFGSAFCPQNEDASCLGQFQTLQFNDRGRIIGCSTFTFLLDKYRISSRHIHQYNIFYQLLAGTTPDEKQALHITHSNFNYLKMVNQRNHQRDLIGFNEFKASLKVCGFKTKTVAQMCQLLSAILHLGNVQFVDGNKHHFGGGGNNGNGSGANNNDHSSPATGVTTSSSQESCRIKNKEILTLVAAALGVATSKLETTLTHKSKLIGNEFCTAFLTTDTASQQRDALAQTLYAALVLWIMNALNQKLSASDTDAAIKSISILDTTGFQLTKNRSAGSFHDLCVNYTGEHLQQYIFHRTLNSDSPRNHERRQDGVWPNIPSSPGIPAPLSLLFYHGTNQNLFALVPFMNRESKRFASYALDATDSNLLSVLFQKKKSTSNNPNHDYRALINPSTPSHSFAIRHYDQTNIDYSVDGFLESNLDSISPDFIHLFKYNCTNVFVHDLFDTSSQSLAGWVTEIHPRDERTVIKAQLPAWPINTKALPIPEEEKVELEETATEEDLVVKKKQVFVTPIQTVLDQVVSGVDTLKELLNGMHISQIIHLCPNDQQKPDLFDVAHITQQLQVLKVNEMAKYAVHFDVLYPYSQHDFLVRYRPLMDVYLPSSDQDSEEEETKSRILEWIQVMQWSEKQVHFGKRDVWIAFDTWRTLENQVRTMEKEARLREKERLAAIEAEKEAIRQAAIAAAIEAEEYEAAQKAEAEAEAAAQAAEIAAIAADRWSSDKNPFDDDCRSDISNDDDRTEIETHFDVSGKKSEWGDDDDSKGLAEG